MREEELLRLIDKTKLPRHIAIIMDGNGRWAKEKGLLRIEGHWAGVETVRRIVRACGELGIEVLTLFTFSTENWARPRKDVEALMGLLKKVIRNEVDELNRNRVKLTAIGRLNELPGDVRKEIDRAMQITAKNEGLILNLALNYSGRSEIVDGVRRLTHDILKGNRNLEEINEELFSNYLYNSRLPDPDLLIRTSGELRISNFLLWEMAYAEIWVTEIFWPDFDRRQLFLAILSYQKRERRFGKVGED